MQPATVVGLTGGIGTGKSTVAKLFNALGIQTIDADRVARKVVKPGTKALGHIQQHFGDNILQDDGTLNRKKLRDIIFTDTPAKAWLEQFLHPLIRVEIIQQLEQCQGPYCILESPLLIETNQLELVNYTIVVTAEKTHQIQRTLQRDDASVAQIESIIASQLSNDERTKYGDFVISNNGPIEALEHQVLDTHRAILALVNA